MWYPFREAFPCTRRYFPCDLERVSAFYTGILLRGAFLWLPNRSFCRALEKGAHVFCSAPPHTYASWTNSRSGTKYGGWSEIEYQDYPRTFLVKGICLIKLPTIKHTGIPMKATMKNFTAVGMSKYRKGIMMDTIIGWWRM